MRPLATVLGLLTLLLVASSPALAQKTVTGTVTGASDGEPLPGANILIEGTTRGTTTDFDGNYSIEVPGDDAVLVYSYIGFISQSELVGPRTTIDVVLQEDSNILDDVVVVGYGTARRGDVTASVATVDVDEANEGLVTAATDFLEGRVAGVNVIENSGEPGANVSVQIRGGTSITASNEPLYVIDGIPVSGDNVTPGGAGQVSNGPARNPLSLINPNDIESITVLKDAAATAIYGSRGSNGVVLITTKDGIQGRVTVDYEGSTSFSSAAQTYDVLSADEYRAFVTQNYGAGSLQGPDATLDVNAFNTSFVDEVFRSAMTQNHNLSFGGGTERTQYRASLSYLNQEGIVISEGQERVTARLNANSQFFDNRLRLGLNLTSALTDDDFTPANDVGGFEGGLFQNVLQYRPIAPVNDPDAIDGYYEIEGQRTFRNPVALANQIDETARTIRSLGNITADLDIVEGLTASINVGGDRSVGTRRAYIPGTSPIGAEFATATTNGGAAYRRTLERLSQTLSTYLTYARPVGAANLNLLGGYEYQEFDVTETAVQAQSFVTDFTQDNLLQSGTVQVAGNNAGPGTFSFRAKNLLASFFTRANVDIADKYYLTGSLRYDGSSRFAEDNRYALFPAVSAAWRVSEEGFLQNNSLISDLRLRAGYGVVGNQSIGDYLYFALLGANPANSAVLNGIAVPGYAPTQLENPDLQWEEKQEFTVGLDYRILSDRVFGSVEFYRNTTDDLLLNVPILASVVATQIQNVGSLRNTGVDLALDAFLIETPSTSFSVGVTFNTNQNEIIDLGGATQLFTGNISGEGQSGGQSLLLTPGEEFPIFYGLDFTGNYNAAGEPIFVDYEGQDLDGDGVIGPLERVAIGETTTVSDDDRVKLGSPRPDFSYGLRLNSRFGRVGVRAFFRGEQGKELFNNTALVYGTRSVAGNRNILDLDYDDAEALNARPTYSSRYIEDASFFRLDQLTVDYALGPVVPQVRDARIFVTGNNLFVITPYSGLDPEVNSPGASADGISSVGVDYLARPRARTITVGINLGI